MTVAKIIEDSVSLDGVRLTTMEVEMHRFILPEFNTHRVFSRNSASSRAIPFAKSVRNVLENPAVPVAYRREQSGMQGGDKLSAADAATAEHVWLRARDEAIESATSLHELGLHKSICNRILEPWQMHRVIVTATEWDGFWEQRVSPLAQPEIRLLAERMLAAYNDSEPELVQHGGWHLPYIDDATADEIAGGQDDPLPVMQAVSAARCARVSYLTHDGTRDFKKDLELFNKLVSARPGHWSPLEHVATPDPSNRAPGNLRGWRQLRHDYDGDNDAS